MAKSTRIGMQTIDQDLFNLYERSAISYEEALRNADSKNELRLRIKLESKREQVVKETDGLALAEEPEDRGRMRM